jgi:hypothetical protein
VQELKAGYEAWFRDVSATRGYDPPRIPVGTPHENPVILTRQDWRMVGADGWGDEDLGFWEIEIASAGMYDIQFRFPQQPVAGRAELQLGSVERQRPFTRGAESLAFEAVPLDAGPARLEARLIGGGKTVGVRYVDVTKQQ